MDSIKVAGYPDIDFDILKSDGKLDANGVATIWVFAHEETLPDFTYGLYRIDLDPVSLSVASHFYPLQIPAGSSLPQGVNPIQPWQDFTPFCVDSNQVRIVAIADDYIHVFSDHGVWIESPWGTKQVADSSAWYYCRPHGALFNAHAIMTTNNRNNWASHSEILIADDFEVVGHGLQRLTWTPDGYDDHLALNIKMRESARSDEPMSKPVLQIENLSAYRQLNDFKVRLWYSRQEGYPSAIQADAYWFEADSITLNTGCLSSNPNLCWTDILYPSSYALDPSNETAVNAAQLGIHYSDWKAWDRTNDFSWQGVTDTLAANQNITVYLKGSVSDQWTKVWGNVPDSTSVSLPYGWIAGPPVVDESESSILVMDDLNGWGCSGNGTCSLDASFPQAGSYSIAVSGGGWSLLESKAFSYSGGLSRIRVAVRQPLTPINPYWAGQVQVWIESKSSGLYSQWVGQVDMTALAKGSWVDLNFNVPTWISQALSGSVSDLVIKFSVNAPNGAGAYDLDNLRLDP